MTAAEKHKRAKQTPTHNNRDAAGLNSTFFFSDNNMHRPQRTPFTTTAISSERDCPNEFARIAHELFTLMGHPDADVQLEPTLDADDEV
nr:hypothetical protein [Pandoravirus massiliensis]